MSLTSIDLPLNENDELRAATRRPSICPSALMISSEMPSLKNSFSVSALKLANGNTAIEGASLTGVMSAWPARPEHRPSSGIAGRGRSGVRAPTKPRRQSDSWPRQASVEPTTASVSRWHRDGASASRCPFEGALAWASPLVAGRPATPTPGTRAAGPRRSRPPWCTDPVGVSRVPSGRLFPGPAECRGRVDEEAAAHRRTPAVTAPKGRSSGTAGGRSVAHTAPHPGCRYPCDRRCDAPHLRLVPATCNAGCQR